MKALSLLLLSANMIRAWLPMSSSGRSLSSLQLSTAVSSTTAFSKPERLVLEKLPTLYVYDHCPFCVRVRFVFGVKNIKHNLYFMANDDVATPTDLVGKKISPILVSRVDSKTKFCSFAYTLPLTFLCHFSKGIPCGRHSDARINGYHQTD
jgi:hypothetical protein